LQLDEPPGTGGEITNDQQCPFVADEIECASIGRPLVIRMTFGWWYLRNGSTSPVWTEFLPTKIESNGRPMPCNKFSTRVAVVRRLFLL
jgi:hypothetical protein